MENKQQIMQNNVETQHHRMYALYIGSLCNVAFPMARVTCIVTSQAECDEAKIRTLPFIGADSALYD